MLIEQLIEYDPRKLESMARELLRRRADIPYRAPIDIEMLLENTENVRLGTRAGMLKKFSVQGCVCCQRRTRRLTVLVDRDIINSPDDSLYRVVLAEEFSHITLHMAMIHHVRSVREYVDLHLDPSWTRCERDAGEYLLFLLMPLDLLIPVAEDEYQHVIDDFGFDDPTVTYSYLRTRLSEAFRVPISAMHARLQRPPCNIWRRVQVSVLNQSHTLVMASSGLHGGLHVQRGLFSDRT